MYVDIYTTSKSRKNPCKAFRRFPAVRRMGGSLYRIQAQECQLRKIRRICRRRHYRLGTVYPESLGRSDTYRREFLRNTVRPRGGYRCRYCHRRLSDERLVVDHIYPVCLAKSGRSIYLRLTGIDDINDVRNLAPSCQRCNMRKGGKTGLWLVRAVLGKYRLYWFIRGLLRICLLLALCALILWCLRINQIISW